MRLKTTVMHSSQRAKLKVMAAALTIVLFQTVGNLQRWPEYTLFDKAVVLFVAGASVVVAPMLIVRLRPAYVWIGWAAVIGVMMTAAVLGYGFSTGDTARLPVWMFALITFPVCAYVFLLDRDVRLFRTGREED
jgi:hypothetical protein